MPDINNILADFRLLGPSIARPESLGQMLKSVASKYYADDANLALANRLLNSIFSDADVLIDITSLNEMDAAYAINIQTMSKHVKHRKFQDDGKNRISTASRATDFIVKTTLEWPLLKLMNFALLLAIPSTERAAVVTSIRNEGISILEWVAHYRSLGFDDIFVYTNSNTDGSTPLLERLARHNIIRLIHNEVDASVPPQTKAYEHSLHFLPELRQFRWVFFLDADEFFIPRCGINNDLDDLFKAMKQQFGDGIPAAISFNWKWFGSENAFEKTDGLLLKRFEHSIHNEHVKTLARLDCILAMGPVHCPVMFRDCFAVDSKFNKLGAITMKTTPVYGIGQINHYWNKSFHEFVIKKLRGRGAVGSTGVQRDFSMFFDWGTNDRRGNYDPQPLNVVERTQKEYDKLFALPGVSDNLMTVNKLMLESIAKIDNELNLTEIYQKRGQIGG